MSQGGAAVSSLGSLWRQGPGVNLGQAAIARCSLVASLVGTLRV